jgi:hypothetical protein
MDDREPCGVYGAFALYPLRASATSTSGETTPAIVESASGFAATASIVQMTREYVIRTGHFASTSLQGPSDAVPGRHACARGIAVPTLFDGPRVTHDADRDVRGSGDPFFRNDELQLPAPS